MSDTQTTLCTEPGCSNVALFSTADGWKCFPHSTPDDTPAAARGEDAAAGPSFAPDVVAGLAAVLLDHTAMTMTGEEDATERAMASLAAATGMQLDFASGLLLALSTLAAAGEVTAEQLTELAAMFEHQAESEDVIAAIGGDTETDTVCELCEASDHTTDEHASLYPLLPDNTDNEEDPQSAATRDDD